MLLMVSGAVPVFRKVDVCAAPVVPTRWDAKSRLAGSRLTAGADGMPVPLSPML
jgi:hypothetical protein